MVINVLDANNNKIVCKDFDMFLCVCFSVVNSGSSDSYRDELTINNVLFIPFDQFF